MVSFERTAVLSLAAAERSPLRRILPYCQYLYLWIREDNESPVSPWPSRARESRLSLSEWSTVCRYLPSTPLVVGLAGLDNEDTAAKALEPLNEMPLSQVAILYYNTSNSETVKVVRSFFRQMIEKELLARGGPFRFLDLPRELRQRMLRFTHLVAPFREVLWKQRRFALYPRAQGLDCERDWKWARHFCCRSGRVYPPCACYRPPIYFFLVCRTMSEDARQVFYSSNRFILVPELPLHPMAGDSMTLLTDANAFLSKALSVQSLRHLRDLEMFFYYRTYSAIAEEGRAGELAVNPTVQLLAQNMGRLSLTVQFDPHFSRAYADLHARDVPLETQLTAQARFVALLQPLRHLAAFFVSIGHREDLTDRQDATRLVRDQEQRLERIVMGKKYDALRHGKTQRRPSLWATAHWCHDYNPQIDG